jgi:hypothetical protein
VKQRLADFVTVLDGGLKFATEKDLLRTSQSKNSPAQPKGTK